MIITINEKSFPEASKKCKKYLTKWLEKSDIVTIDEPLTNGKSITKIVYYLKLRMEISHVDMILAYVNRNGNIKLLNVNRLIIRKQKINSNYHVVQLNPTKLTYVINQIFETLDATEVFVPIAWVSQHARLKIVNASCFYAFAMQFTDNIPPIENYFEWSIYDKRKDKRFIYKNYSEFIKALATAKVKEVKEKLNNGK